ncbi:hypothetical protein F5X98DRAFT_336801 [Xylaria grammica]|nr:hypothetical protein F5X98DRAFT_336801 [Xylaria grammica]
MRLSSIWWLSVLALAEADANGNVNATSASVNSQARSAGELEGKRHTKIGRRKRTERWRDPDDPCRSAEHELGREYGETECPATHGFLADGSCDWTTAQPGRMGCAVFCQVRMLKRLFFLSRLDKYPSTFTPKSVGPATSSIRDILKHPLLAGWDWRVWVLDCALTRTRGTTFLPTREVPIQNTFCRGPGVCAAPRTVLQVDSWWSGTEAATSALADGVSGGFDAGLRAVALTTRPKDAVALGEGECGYYTWIGTKKSVCGTLTEATAAFSSDGQTQFCAAPAKTTTDLCAESIAQNDAEEASGTPVFVRVDCASRTALPGEVQHPLFRFADVALSPSRLEQTLRAWEHKPEDGFLWSSFGVDARRLLVAIWKFLEVVNLSHVTLALGLVLLLVRGLVVLLG